MLSDCSRLTVAAQPPDSRPILSVVVDTEEEFDWSKPFARESNAVESIERQAAMHVLFRRYCVRPTYVVDYPVATSPRARTYLGALHDLGECEIGAHLHPWVNPPFEETISVRNSYPGNLPPALERRKLEVLTEAITDAFGIQPRVYKAGRYGVGVATSRILDELRYDVDASVVPHRSYAADGGPDFRHLPDRPYWFGEGRRMLEFPVTRGFAGAAARHGARIYRMLDHPMPSRLHVSGILIRTRILDCIPLTPEGNSFEELSRLTLALLRQGHRIFSLCYHSPSVSVGNTPYVRNEKDLLRFVRDTEKYLAFFAETVGGCFATPTEVRNLLAARVQPDSCSRGARPGIEASTATGSAPCSSGTMAGRAL